MADPKVDLKGVIQVKDGDGWDPFKPEVVFQPIMDAIKAIRAEYPNIYIGLTYGANANTQTPKMFSLYGFTEKNTPSTGKQPVDIAGAIDTTNTTAILDTISGTGQAEVLSSPDVKNMLKDVKRFIIIPFDTMNSNVDKDGNGNLDAYGHKNDCLVFAQKFLNIDKSKGGSIIIGWQPMVSEFTISTRIKSGTDLTTLKQGDAVQYQFKNLYFALGAGAAGPLDATAKEYIDFLIQNWNKESQEFIDSKIVPGGKPLDDAGKKLDGDPDTKLDGDADTKLDSTEKKPAGVTAEQIKELQDQLSRYATLTDADGEKKTAYGIAKEIFKSFFGGGDDKSKQTKEFLTEKVAELATMAIFGKDPAKGNLDKITTRLETPSIANKIEVKDDANEKKVNAKKSAAAGADADNLSIMTFNTWYLSFNAGEKIDRTPGKVLESAKFCETKCSENNRQAILAQMAKPGPVIIFLQEFTYNFDTFFKGDGPDDVIINNDGFSSTIKAKDSNKADTSIPAFRYFTMTYKANKFHVYIGQIGDSVIATIYSDTLTDGEPADEFFVGNLAAGTLAKGKTVGDKDPKSYDLAYTFSGNKKSPLTVDKNPDTPVFGGHRPFIILKLNKGIILNLHAPHSDSFKTLKDPLFGKKVDEFAFDALARFVTETVLKSGSTNDYTFIAGGDFNTDAATSISRLEPIFKDINATTISRNGSTCCTTDGGLDFKNGAFDHIFSTLKFSAYNVYDATTLEKTKQPNPRYFFSDHLPVYATIAKPPEEPAAEPGAPAGSSRSSWISLFSSSSSSSSSD